MPTTLVFEMPHDYFQNEMFWPFDQKIVSECDQEKPQSQTADKPMAPRGKLHNNHETPGRQTKQSKQFSLPNQYDYKTRMDIK